MTTKKLTMRELEAQLARTTIEMARLAPINAPPGEWTVAGHTAVVDHTTVCIALGECALAGEKDKQVVRNIRAFIRRAKEARMRAKAWARELKTREARKVRQGAKQP
jgi:hypothetical protein